MSGLFGGGGAPSTVSYAPISEESVTPPAAQAQPEVKPEGGPIDKTIRQRVDAEKKTIEGETPSLLGN